VPDSLFGQGSEIGKALFGSTQASYDKGAHNAVTLQSALLDARKKRREEMAAEGVREKMIAAGIPPDKADLLSTMFGAGYNPTQLSGYQADEQGVGFRNELMDMVRGGAGIGEINPGLAVIDGKPVQLQRSMGQGVYTPNAYDPTSEPQTNELGDALVGAADALAGQRAATGQAALIRANRPPAAKAPRAAASHPEDAIIQQARERIAAGADPQTVANYLRKKGYPGAAKKIAP
jgi:hypothetical protein